MPSSRSDLGKQAETLAAEELTRRGYEVIETNFRARLGEIDIIARDKDTLVFVEVRSRKTTYFGLPSETITYPKQQKLIRTANLYLSMKHLQKASCRFDVVEVIFEDDDPKVTLIRDAFGTR